MRFPLLLRQIVGASMVPQFEEGRIIVASGWFRALKKQDVIIVRHNGMEKIKRIHDIRADKLFILGDNLGESTDSRDFGWIDKKVVRAKVLWPRTNMVVSGGELSTD